MISISLLCSTLSYFPMYKYEGVYILPSMKIRETKEMFVSMFGLMFRMNTIHKNLSAVFSVQVLLFSSSEETTLNINGGGGEGVNSFDSSYCFTIETSSCEKILYVK